MTTTLERSRSEWFVCLFVCLLAVGVVGQSAAILRKLMRLLLLWKWQEALAFTEGERSRRCTALTVFEQRLETHLHHTLVLATMAPPASPNRRTHTYSTHKRPYRFLFNKNASLTQQCSVLRRRTQKVRVSRRDSTTHTLSLLWLAQNGQEFPCFCFLRTTFAGLWLVQNNRMQSGWASRLEVHHDHTVRWRQRTTQYTKNSFVFEATFRRGPAYTTINTTITASPVKKHSNGASSA